LNHFAQGTCALCEREVARISKHHLTPKSEGGTRTTDLCPACHKTLHKFFTNRTLARELNTIDALRQNPEVQKYLAWVRKQPDRSIRVRTSRRRR
jgi:5-methylcytosine-specific restriction protein A